MTRSLLKNLFQTYGGGGLKGKLTALLIALSSPVAADDVVILALGDSLTQGYGLLDQDGFVPQMRNWLAEQGEEVRLINGGVSGDTTAGGLARVDWALTSDVQAMIVALGGNDLLRGIDPSVARANLEGILQVAEAKGVKVLLVGMQASGNYGQDYKRAFDGMYPELAAEYDALLAASFFQGLQGEGADLAAVRDLMQDDGIHPNEEGVKRIVAALGPKVQELIDRVE